MATFTATVTSAGFQTLADALITGNLQDVKAKFGQGQYTPTGSETDITSPFSPVKEFNVSVAPAAAQGKYRAVFQDGGNPSAAYNIGEVGLFDPAGTMLAIASRPAADGWLVQKQANSFVLVEFEVDFTNSTAAVTLNPATYGWALWTSSHAGVVQKAANLDSYLDTVAMSAKQVRDAIAKYAPGPNKVAASKTSGSPPNGASNEADAGLEVTITPSSTTSEVLLELTQPYIALTGAAMYYHLYEDSTKIATGRYQSSSNVQTLWPVYVRALVTPGDTNAHTYKVRWYYTQLLSGVTAPATDRPLILTAEEID